MPTQKDRDVGFLQPPQRLIKVELAERVEARGQHQNGFLALHVAELADCFEYRIEEIRFAEAGKKERSQYRAPLAACPE